IMAGKLVPLPGSDRPARPDAKKVGKINPKERVEVTLDIRGPAASKGAAPPAEKLSKAEFLQAFGAKEKDLDKVQKVLESYGLIIEEKSAATRSVRASGTVAQLEKAFAPKLAVYQSKGVGKYRGRESALKIPAELKGIVLGVYGLDA